MLVILSVIPSSTINHLSQNFNWWLRSILLKFWHIQIININDSPCSKPWSKCISSSLFNLHVNNILHNIAVSLSGETNFDDQPFCCLQFLIKHILNVFCLTSTSWSNK